MLIKQDFPYPDGTNRTAHIYLPDDWQASSEKYPVMYFFDGHNLYRDSDATYGKCWGLETFLNNWSKKMIVVGLECSHAGRERLNEYCPYTLKDTFLGDLTGKGSQTVEWIINVVKPVIDRTYPTWAHREATGIAGSSMGGLMSIYAAFHYNKVFSKAGCLSSTILPCKDLLLQEIRDADISPDTRIYLSWGTDEAGSAATTPDAEWSSPMALSNLAVSQAFQHRNAKVYLYCQRYGRHCEADWEKQVPIFLNFLWLDK